MILVDTNVVSELARPRPDPNVVRWMREQDGVVISVLTIEELAFGVARSPTTRRTKLSAWFDQLLASVTELVEVSAPIARASGELRAGRQAVGRQIAQADALIAATALVRGLSLATRNVRDFDDCGVIVIDPFS